MTVNPKNYEAPRVLSEEILFSNALCQGSLTNKKIQIQNVTVDDWQEGFDQSISFDK